MSLTLGRRIGSRSRDHQLLRADPARTPPPAGRVVPWWAVAATALPPALLTAGWLVAGLFQPASYSPVRATVSVLAGYSGADRWIMTDAMLLAAAAYLISAAGLTSLRPAARTLLVVAGLCSAGIAASPEPAAGPSAMHVTWTVIGAITITIWPAVAGWRVPPHSAAVSARGCLAVTLVFAAMLGWVVLEIMGGGALGLAERATASVQTSWPFVVALVLYRRAAPGVGPPARELDQAGRR